MGSAKEPRGCSQFTADEFCMELVVPYFKEYAEALDWELDNCKTVFEAVSSNYNRGVKWLQEIEEKRPKKELLPFEIHFIGGSGIPAIPDIPLIRSSRELCFYSGHCKSWYKAEKEAQASEVSNLDLVRHFVRFKAIHLSPQKIWTSLAFVPRYKYSLLSNGDKVCSKLKTQIECACIEPCVWRPACGKCSDRGKRAPSEGDVPASHRLCMTLHGNPYAGAVQKYLGSEANINVALRTLFEMTTALKPENGIVMYKNGFQIDRIKSNMGSFNFPFATTGKGASEMYFKYDALPTGRNIKEKYGLGLPALPIGEAGLGLLPTHLEQEFPSDQSCRWPGFSNKACQVTGVYSGAASERPRYGCINVAGILSGCREPHDDTYGKIVFEFNRDFIHKTSIFSLHDTLRAGELLNPMPKKLKRIRKAHSILHGMVTRRLILWNMLSIGLQGTKKRKVRLVPHDYPQARPL